ncbi:MAG: polysaccharide pyruvyl transferase family protein [Bacteroidaceae bacterium]|nr:polysaccharide pyruvyl transferase family protein [Bacteroidaceae bacterium]
MKIGILTLPLHNNFGGILQAYALQRVLKNMEHKAILIDKSRYVSLGPWYKRYPIYIKNAILKHIMQQKVVVRPDVEINKTPKIIAQHTELFINKYIERIYTRDFSDIKKNKFDAIIVGSDQIWRPKYFFSRIENAYLDFAKKWNIKRISYAASFGAEEWEYDENQTINCTALLKKFDAISVRESSAKVMCENKFGVEALHVLDPTMLLTKENYIEIFKEACTQQSKGNLFCYILDNKKETNIITDCIAKNKGLKPFFVNSRYEEPNAPLEERIQKPVEKWLRAFYDAEFVITDSFHACVFSIIFNKPFIVYGNRERGMARFESLLKLFELEERLVSSLSEVNKVLQMPIDWERVNSIYKQMKEKSLSFLAKNLN